MRLPRAELTTRLLSRCGALSQDEGGAVLPQLITVTCRPCARWFEVDKPQARAAPQQGPFKPIRRGPWPRALLQARLYPPPLPPPSPAERCAPHDTHAKGDFARALRYCCASAHLGLCKGLQRKQLIWQDSAGLLFLEYDGTRKGQVDLKQSCSRLLCSKNSAQHPQRPALREIT